jgi:SAM-dependent methyltransferase
MPLDVAFYTHTRTYVRCRDCGLVFQNPRPTTQAVEEFYRTEYDTAYGMAESGENRDPVFRAAFNHLGSLRKPPGRLLDVGCGAGNFLELCAEAGWTCFGVELSREAAKRAALRPGITLLPSDWNEGAGDAEHTYSVVTLINVLETVPDPLALLSRVHRALDPDGVVLIRAQNGNLHLRVRRIVQLAGLRYQQAFHLYLYSPVSLGRLLRKAGFEPISLRNSTLSLAPPSGAAWGSGLIWRLGRVALNISAWVMHAVSGGRVVWAPSFEIAARKVPAATGSGA